MLPTSNAVFLDSVRNLINNLIVNNANNNNSYFYGQTKFDYRDDVIERGKYILEAIEGMKHLVIDDKEDDSSWVTNPDRMGGQFTQQEIDDANTWR